MGAALSFSERKSESGSPRQREPDGERSVREPSNLQYRGKALDIFKLMGGMEGIGSF